MEKISKFRQKLPSLGLSPEHCLAIHAMLDSEYDYDDNALTPKTSQWIRDCYNRPRNGELALSAMDELLGNFGVEGFEAGGNVIEYSNTGDSYADTICCINGRFVISSWSDLAEKYNQEGE